MGTTAWAQARNEMAHGLNIFIVPNSSNRHNGAARTVGCNKETSSSPEALAEMSVTSSGNGVLPDIETYRPELLEVGTL